MTTPEELRRQDDVRYRDLDRKISGVAKDVTTIREMLISEPAASPLGRALLEKTAENRSLIRELRDDFEPDHEWLQQFRGSARVVLYVPTVVSAIAAVMAIAVGMGWKL